MVDEQAIARLPERTSGPSLEQNGRIDPYTQVAELTALSRREGWSDGLRYLVRRVKPSRRHAK